MITVKIKIGSAPEIILSATDTEQETRMRSVEKKLNQYYKQLKTTYSIDETNQILAMLAIYLGLENVGLQQDLMKQDSNALSVLNDINTSLDNFLPKEGQS